MTTDLGHALAVADLRVEHAVGRQHVEQVLLPRVVPTREYVTLVQCSSMPHSILLSVNSHIKVEQEHTVPGT